VSLLALAALPALLASCTSASQAVDTTAQESLASEPGRWVPPPGFPWQWELDHPLRLDDAHDMGTGWVAAGGAPARPPTVFDIDGFSNDASVVGALHQRGARVICYIEVGGWEPSRSDRAEFPPAVIGKPVDGFPEERYLDIRSTTVLKNMIARIDMCASKGFDAIEPDLDDTYTEDTGFELSAADSVQFDHALAQHAHALGLSIALKNGDEPAFAMKMQPLVDFAVVEQCFEFDTCDSFTPFTKSGKAVLEVEYNLDPVKFCSEAATRSFSAVLHEPELAGGGTPCR